MHNGGVEGGEIERGDRFLVEGFLGLNDRGSFVGAFVLPEGRGGREGGREGRLMDSRSEGRGGGREEGDVPVLGEVGDEKGKIPALAQ